MSQLRRRRADLSALALLLLIVALFYFPLWGQRLWLPQGGGDLASFLFPMYRAIAASLHAGEIPLWNPYQYAGAPLIGDNQAGIFYPFHLLLFLLNPNFSYRWLQLLVAWHLLWAGVGLYLCARDWRCQPLPALFGATAFMFSGVFITHQGNLNLIAVAAWLPWSFFCLRRALNRRSPGWLALCAVTIGVSTLAGHGQVTFMLALLLSVYAVWRAVVGRTLQPLLFVAAAGLLGALLAALILLPIAAMSPLTGRGAFSYEQTTNYSLPWLGLVGLLAPNFYGRGPAAFWAAWPRVEYGYVGVSALLLALAALRRERRWLLGDGGFLTLLTLIAMLLALGGNTPVHRWLLAPLQLPFQVPARFVLLADFALALLAAAGLQRLLHGERRWWPLWLLLPAASLLLLLRARSAGPSQQMLGAIAVLALLLLLSALLLWLSTRLDAHTVGLFAVAVLCFDLFLNGMYVEIERDDPSRRFQQTAAIDFLQQNSGINRIDAATALWQPATAQLYGLYSVGGVFNPLALANYSDYMASLGYRGSPQYDLLGVKYIVAAKQQPPSDQPSIVPVFNGDPEVDVYLNAEALPRAAVYYKTIIDPQMFERLHSDVDLADTLILARGVALDGPAAAYQIGVIEYGRNRVILDVTTEASGYLLLTDIYYPGWQATVDGQAAAIEPADFAFRAILLEPGSHRVEMRFQPRSWRAGVALSLLGWTLVLALLRGNWKTINEPTRKTTDNRRL